MPGCLGESRRCRAGASTCRPGNAVAACARSRRRHCLGAQDILAPLLHVNELRRHGVTLHLLLDADRQPIPDVPAVYYVHPNEASIQRVLDDLSRGLYASFHLNFSTHIPRPLMEKLAAGGRAGRVGAGPRG